MARFAESHGYEQDYDRPCAHHYRDFLIKALNQDMPFDQLDPKIEAAIADVQNGADRNSTAWQTAQAWFATTLPQWQELNRVRSPEK